MESSGFFGIILSVGVVVLSPVFFGGGFTDMIDPVAAFLFSLGLFSALMIQFPLSWIGLALSEFQVFFKTHNSAGLKKLLPQIVYLSVAVRKEGFASFETKLIHSQFKIKDAVLIKAVERLASGMEPKSVYELSEQEIRVMTDKIEQVPKVIKSAALLAPGIGAFLGIIKMAQAVLMMDQIKNLGPLLAGSFICLIYGLACSFLFLNPWAGRIQMEQEGKIREFAFTLAAVKGLAEGVGPQTLEERLKGLII